jgi:hypothetical protein
MAAKLQRRDDWPERLAQYLEEAREREKEWGVFDCGMFAAGAIEAMTGVDLAAEFRGKYAGSISAEKAMRRYCGGGLEQLAVKVARKAALAEIDPRLAQRGDPVLVRDAEVGDAFGVIDIRGFLAVTVSGKGLAYRERTAIVRAWRV